MADPRTCPRCGHPLPTDAAGGLCPACVLDVALNLSAAPPHKRHRTAPPPAPFRRKQLLHYQLLEKIGEGGMGAVYKARDTRLDRIVAIKILPADKVDDRERRRRFIFEAKAASALNHPNIVTIYEVAAAGGIHFIVMEFVAGRTLDQLVGRNGLPPEQVLLYAVPIAGALAQAHEAGIVHRDLKPQNIMVRDDGLVKLLDFGLAKLVEAEPVIECPAELEVPPSVRSGGSKYQFTPERRTQATSLSETTRIMGTPGFMAPEQFNGGKVDGRTDLFAFGAVLYHALSGRNPFARPTADETFAAILHDEPTPLDDVPRHLTTIIARCLRKDPNDRFQTAAELQSALRCASTASSPQQSPASVAVLPFANMSGRPEDDYFGDALSGEIITALARIPGLKVSGRTSTLMVAAARLAPRAIGEQLGVAHLLEGSVQRTETTLHVAARLIHAADGTCLWAESYDRAPADVFAVQDGIAQAVAGRLGVRPDPPVTPSGRPTENLEAYHYYLLGRHAADLNELATAMTQFQHAVRLDPNFALAYDGLAETWWFLGFFGVIPPRDAFGQGIWAALRALEIDDKRADTHALVAMYRKELDYNWAEVRREFQRARELDPCAPKVRTRYALSGLMPAGRLEEACAECEEILRTDPLSFFARLWLALMLQMRRQHEAAIEQCRVIIAQEPRYPMSYQELAVGLACLGQGSEALAAMRTYAEYAQRSPLSLGLLGWICGREKRTDEARLILAELDARARAGYVPPSSAALVYCGLGELDNAVEQIDRAIEARDPIVISLKFWPPFDSVHAHPRYPELLRKMNMEP